MILTDGNIDSKKIDKLIGKALMFNWKNRRVVGGVGMFLSSFENKTSSSEKLKVNSKCNLEIRGKGLLLHSNFSGKRSLVPIVKADILEIKLIRGEEKINPIPFSRMWILLKLGFSVLQSRYFGLTKQQYSIDSMEMSLKTDSYEMVFNANGFLFERQEAFLECLDLGDRLAIIKGFSN
ncbi:hypothetical protein [uncultured Dokdonia sp.]|uniref:hypothetical protein n=1 Tax=uncultured Dokdonia sp. TaxID=575653 RepID=UPI0030ECEC72|tara:strand:- start:70167 stop:70703 length:537 start_codon:yes stop_codon:yes gene_type:complete